LLETSINGASGVIVNITGGPDMTLHEITDAANIIHDAVLEDATVIIGTAVNENIQGEIQVTVIATGFEMKSQSAQSEITDSKQLSASDFFAGTFGPSTEVRPAQSVQMAKPSYPEMPANFTNIEIPDFLKKYFFAILIFISLVTSGYMKPDVYTINAEKNAFYHNNVGLRYLNERCYYAAIQEFKIAISLAQETQATSVYYKNLGDTYMAIAYPDWAQDCYEKAIKIYNLNFQYYLDLAKCYKARKIIPQKIKEYSKLDNPLNQVMLGVLRIESGDLKGGIIALDAFTNSEPDLIITPAVKQYIRETVKQLNK